MGEFELIRRYFLSPAGRQESGSLILGPGDDCAIQRIPPGRDLVFSVDAFVEGVHFPRNYRSDYLGWRVLAAAASDLAAMGADPECFTLALTLPSVDEQWLEGFSTGLRSASGAFGFELAGGDTTSGPLTLSLQVHGTVEQGSAVRRSGAHPGDLIAVSGTLGNAGAALDYLAEPEPCADMLAVMEHYHRPWPRLDLAVAVRQYASAAIDISDGLLADLGHILAASRVGARVERARLPLSSALSRLKGDKAVDYALRSGDDYELCVCFPPNSWERAPEPLKSQFTVIGVVDAGSGLYLDDVDCGLEAAPAGYDHFRSER
ncbi:thiamine-phosphate kinase [Marinobacter sp. es.048]|uniref:thiamine-phosphate kinase n=1 Tax=Marinobacter sp. es.048 TaxID=1761795 RepID=UPI000B5914C9|nr:thiamine-phosphate kinase [Marinobacter sp. es.048]SNC76578.1 thiamine-phosphate kinase [Marinobacter sp. es.048]